VLKGRTAVIVGASSGIGESLARELNREGWRLGLLARRLDRLEALRETLSPETVVRRIDVAQPDAASILERLLEELGGVDWSTTVPVQGIRIATSIGSWMPIP
jgi:NADP-dependent 3-hydroxy acid dehydrogenase YdfG